MAEKSSIKDAIIRQVRIVDIADEFNLPLEEISSHNFDKRCKCPSRNHKNGSEKTPSLYIDSTNNNYYCYGCASSFNSIDFYMICADLTFSEAILILKERVKDYSQYGGSSDAPQDNFPIILETSHLFRETMQQHPRDLKWINSLMQKTDQYLEGIKKEEVEKTKSLLISLKRKIKERYQ